MDQIDFSYFKSLVDHQYEDALAHLQRIINGPVVETMLDCQEKANKFILWCLDKYREKDTCLYVLAKDAFWRRNPIDFLEDLASFVGNCIYDDGYYTVEYRDYPDGYYRASTAQETINFACQGKTVVRRVNGIFGYTGKEMLHWQPVIKYVSDTDPNATHDPVFLLSAANFIDTQREELRLYEKSRFLL